MKALTHATFRLLPIKTVELGRFWGSTGGHQLIWLVLTLLHLDTFHYLFPLTQSIHLVWRWSRCDCSFVLQQWQQRRPWQQSKANKLLAEICLFFTPWSPPDEALDAHNNAEESLLDASASLLAGHPANIGQVQLASQPSQCWPAMPMPL